MVYIEDIVSTYFFYSCHIQVWGSVLYNEKFETLTLPFSSLKTAGGHSGKRAMKMRSMEMPEKVLKPPKVAGLLLRFCSDTPRF